MKTTPTELPGVLIVEPDVFKDSRGYFLETYQEKKYAQAGIPDRFVQDNRSLSRRGTLRGLHAQLRSPQAKLIHVISGEIFDVVVDIRKGSPTYRKWIGVTLSGDNFRQLFVPRDFAHGFYVVSNSAEIQYKVTGFYDPSDELHLLWNDPAIGITWPEGERLLSEKDREGRPLSAWEAKLPVYQEKR